MPTHETGGPVVVKMVGYHPANPVQRGLPSVIATSSMWDTETGHLVAIADATLLTAVRTGAASALATELLARTGPIVVGLAGLGAQAVTQLHAISRIRPIERVVGFDDDSDVAASFPARAAFLGLDIDTSGPDRAATILGEVDVLCTCTSVDIGAGPVVADGETRPWLHVNAVGADFPGKVELPSTFANRAFVVPDTLAQCRLEGECQQVSPDRIGPSLSEIMQRSDEFVERRDELTVFDSTGWAVEDDVALRVAVELATIHGVGSEIELERLPKDPYDPYGEA
jgi:ornithine cyclodeaminase/alanine dehydrogenase-like protein (mu-crystallin family)